MNAGGPRWRPAYVGMGSNLDDPPAQLRQAIAALGEIPETRLLRTSPFYRSAPLDGSGQPDYINAVVALLTRLDAAAFLEALQQIETAQGRRRGADRWGPRTLDLDLLVYSGDSMNSAGLKIPHPGIGERNFVLLPLCDIAPHLRIPGLGSVSGLAAGTDRNNPRIERLS